MMIVLSGGLRSVTCNLSVPDAGRFTAAPIRS